MAVEWFMPRNGERQRLLTLHIWLYGSSCYRTVNDEDYVQWFINDANLKVWTAHLCTCVTAVAAEGGLEGLEPPQLTKGACFAHCIQSNLPYLGLQNRYTLIKQSQLL